ncbi:MAG: glycosyltransferase, partial [Marinirhabdus sp.]|nr:glycosyltransferase [Marinirhabdus sp.]
DTPQEVEGCIYMHMTATGPCISRNTGVRKSTGDILVFLDDDARIGTDFIHEITAPIRSGNYPVVAGAICDPEGNYLNTQEQYLTKGSYNFMKVITSNPNHDQSRITLAVPGCCMALTREVFDTIGGFNENFDPTGAGEDRDVALKCYKHGFAIWYNAKAKLLHAVNAAGGSRDVGSRTLMLDVHTYLMCKEHFSEQLAHTLRDSIIQRYRKQFHHAVLKGKLVRTKYALLKQAKQLMP